MSDRWKMSRMGFVNFWLYDEETFEFEDGKLLLRGQNGSGKSITTQSFIPFILDGDRTPSRLDPFGSGDRKMDYYFLGEDGREESTGYLFMEFERGDRKQYRTIGIGQRARRGAPMTFWGFVLTDGRRIGYDLNLYKEVGSAKIPYSKQDLKKLLGPDIPFTDAPGEYKAMVNKHIFGFRRMEQYEQFIRLLVKVRAPKLSKEFKPTKVYEILNESLQTLTDEDLRAMVDAMEKMDSIQNSLDHLKTAQKDAMIIQNEYTRYNQFMLARKAKAYLDANSQAERLKAELEAEEDKQERLAQEETEKRGLEEQSRQDKGLVEAELDGLRDTDLDTVSERLAQNRNRHKKLDTELHEWNQRAGEARERLLESDRRMRDYESTVQSCLGQIGDSRKELEELQEILQFEWHEQAAQKIRQEETDDGERIARGLREWKQKIGNGLKILKEQEALEAQYNEAAKESADCLARTVTWEDVLTNLEEREEKARDAWIQECYELPQNYQELIPERPVLEELETRIAAYEGPKDRTQIHKIWESCAQRQRKILLRLHNQKEQESGNLHREQLAKREELADLQKRKDWEPDRSQEIECSRELLRGGGISWTTFYQAVEFAPRVSKEEQNLLEEQLKDAGLLDALVVERSDWNRVRTEFPEYADRMICVPERTEGVPFKKLVPAKDLSDGLKRETESILKAISGSGAGLILLQNGFFKNGILEGRSLGNKEASLIGELARKRRLEQQIARLRQEMNQLEEEEEKALQERQLLEQRMEILEQELSRVPDAEAVDAVLEEKRECLWTLEKEREALERARREEERFKQQRDQCLQKVIRMGKELPYARTCAAYQEAEESAQEYLNIWGGVCSQLGALRYQKSLIESEKEKAEQYEETQDTAIREASEKEKELKILEMAIGQAEEFLNRPENRQLAKRLEELRGEKARLEDILEETGKRLAVIGSQKEETAKKLEEKKAARTERIRSEANLRTYFEEELNLKLVMEREDKALKDCASQAMGSLRESDKNREPAALADSLYQVYHKYSSSLVSYGIAMEDCFSEGAADGQGLRKRQRIVSVWNGKKLYFAQFCQALRTSIEETELLIQEKDRELFVDILSRTLSRQLTERIAESRQWIQTMSDLMRQMDTSMGLSFSLEWKAKTAQSEQEIDTFELEKLLRRDQKLLTQEDIERVAKHFRSKIREEKQRLDDNGGMVNYMDLVRDALDYRKWFEFQMFYYRNQEGRKPLTNAAFNKFSGGEKAMAMYVPLFAAVNAQYQKSSKEDFPRIIALDEAFAGVDDKNISSMFQLVNTLDFDYIMNSQVIWGCYETVSALRISELHRPGDAQVVTVIHYTWNGHERILNEQ